VRLAHFSVKEYLISDRILKGTVSAFYQDTELANKEILETCVQYLIMLDKENSISPTSLKDYPLLDYAARLWFRHMNLISSIQLDQSVQNIILRLFKGRPNCFLNWIRVFEPTTMAPHRPENCLELDPDGEGYTQLGSPLYYASRLGFEWLVERLLREDERSSTDINATGGLFGTPLLAAAAAENDLSPGLGNIKIVKLLLQYGADANASGHWPGNALSFAIQKGNDVILQLLLDAGAAVNLPAGREPILHEAIRLGNQQAVEHLLQAHTSVDTKDVIGKSSILVSCSDIKYMPCLAVLLKHGANVHDQDSVGRTALHYAVNAGASGSTILLLLRYGASPQTGDRNGIRPFDQGCCPEATREKILSNLRAATDITSEPEEEGKTWILSTYDAAGG
jgi:hypothetical protein